MLGTRPAALALKRELEGPACWRDELSSAGGVRAERSAGTAAVIDLLVAGGGPAGLVTALYAARAGLEVVVFEPRAAPIDKACGEGLMPQTLARLQSLGVDPPGQSLRGIRYLDERRCATADFRVGLGRGVRRTVLQTTLLDAVRAAEVVVVPTAVGRVSQSANVVRAAGLSARYLAAADGLHSPIRQQLGLSAPDSRQRRWGIRRHFAVAPWSEHVEVHWSAEAEAYVTPVGGQCVGVAVLSSQRRSFAGSLAGFTVLSDRLRGLEHGEDRAAGPLRQRVRSRSAGRVLLVGDAAGYLDALTGEGLGVAFATAELLVETVLANRCDLYDRRWRAMTRRYRMLTAALLQASRCQPVRPRLVSATAAMPRAFEAFVNQLAR